MKIGYVARWWPEYGGSYQYDLFAISALRRASPDIDLVVFYSDDRLPQDLDHLKESVRFIKLADASRGISSRIVRRTLRFFYESSNLPVIFANLELKKHKLDVCVGTAPFTDCVFSDCASVLMVHDLWFLPSAGLRLQRSNEDWRILRTQIGILNSDVIVVESPRGRRDMVRYAKIDESSVKIMPLPTAPFVTKYMGEKLPPPTIVSKPYVFYPGHYLPFKNHIVTLKALHLLKYKGIRLSAVFCGPVTSPHYRDELVRLTAEFGLQKQVVFEGWLPGSDVAALYQHAAAHVMSSKFGPTNMPIWEAMAFGTPVISCDVGDMPWQVGDAGLIFPADDEQVLASHLERIIGSPELANEYISRGKKKFASLRQEVWGQSFFNILKEAVEIDRVDPATTWDVSVLRPKAEESTNLDGNSAASR
jgi:glycosyltransferase involved in cell wall biosynthesis